MDNKRIITDFYSLVRTLNARGIGCINCPLFDICYLISPETDTCKDYSMFIRILKKKYGREPLFKYPSEQSDNQISDEEADAIIKQLMDQWSYILQSLL